MPFSSLPQIVPVIDIMRGIAVRGQGGARRSYRSVLEMQPPGLTSDEPLEVARWYRSRYGLRSLYVADLDAIMSNSPSVETIEPLLADGFSIASDSGWNPDDAESSTNTWKCESSERRGSLTRIYSSESLRSPERLESLSFSDFNSPRTGSRILSIDLFRGSPWLGELPASQSQEPLSHELVRGEQDSIVRWVRAAIVCGIKQILLLDLADVGGAQGVSTLALLPSLKRDFPEIVWWVGGGVRSVDDLGRAGEAGASYVLMASALLRGDWPAGAVGLG